MLRPQGSWLARRFGQEKGELLSALHQTHGFRILTGIDFIRSLSGLPRPSRWHKQDLMSGYDQSRIRQSRFARRPSKHLGTETGVRNLNSLRSGGVLILTMPNRNQFGVVGPFAGHFTLFLGECYRPTSRTAKAGSGRIVQARIFHSSFLHNAGGIRSCVGELAGRFRRFCVGVFSAIIWGWSRRKSCP